MTRAPHLPSVADVTSWTPVDLRALLDGDAAETRPTLLAREDGAHLLYAGKLHAVSGEPESCKGWLALHACGEAIAAGENVVYIDFEDGPETMLRRLRELGCEARAIVARFAYLRPDEPLGDNGRIALDNVLRDQPALVVVDGLTEVLTLEGLDLRDNVEVARWLALLPRPIARSGAAVLLIDHVAKDKDTRGRYAIGAQHKLAGVDVAYGLEVVSPFGRGRDGLVRLKVKKDRPGHIRQLAADDQVAELRLRSLDDGAVEVQVAVPAGGAEEFRPTVLMERLSRAIETNPGQGKRDLREAVYGNNVAKDKGLQILVAEGFVEVRAEGSARRHTSVRPYRQDDDRALVPEVCPDRAQAQAESHRAHVPLPFRGARGTGHDDGTAESGRPCPDPDEAAYAGSEYDRITEKFPDLASGASR